MSKCPDTMLRLHVCEHIMFIEAVEMEVGPPSWEAEWDCPQCAYRCTITQTEAPDDPATWPTTAE